MKTFPTASGTKQQCLLSSLLFTIVPVVIASIVRQEKEAKRNEKNKIFINHQYTCLAAKPKRSIYILLELIRSQVYQPCKI